MLSQAVVVSGWEEITLLHAQAVVVAVQIIAPMTPLLLVRCAALETMEKMPKLQTHMAASSHKTRALETTAEAPESAVAASGPRMAAQVVAQSPRAQGRV